MSAAHERRGARGRRPNHGRDRTRHWGRGHPTSEGPTSGARPGDAPAGPLVRPYTITKGRTRPPTEGGRLDMITIVMAVGDHDGRPQDPERQEILDLCRRPISVAEVSARLDIPLTVVRVLLGDLIAQGDVRTRADTPMTKLPEKKVLQAVLDGIRRL